MNQKQLFWKKIDNSIRLLEERKVTATAKLAIFFILFFICQHIVFPIFFNITVGSDLWRAIFVFTPSEPFYVWTFLTSIFGHATAQHIFMNLVWWLLFAYIVEDLTSEQMMILVFTVSGIIGITPYLFLNTITSSTMTAGIIGASGGIAGLFGFTTIIYDKNRMLQYGFLIPLAIFFVTKSIHSIILNGTITHIGHLSHLGGIWVGLCGGIIYTEFKGETSPSRASSVSREQVE